jgi:hypothetical protein
LQRLDALGVAVQHLLLAGVLESSFHVEQCAIGACAWGLWCSEWEVLCGMNGRM